MEIKIPTAITLKKYGLSAEEWKAILDRQGGVCAVCKKVPSSGRLNTDHHHVPKWKQMPAEQRKMWVRGLLCYFCNLYYCGRAITVAKAENVVTYLKEFEAKRPQ